MDFVILVLALDMVGAFTPMDYMGLVKISPMYLDFRAFTPWQDLEMT